MKLWLTKSGNALHPCQNRDVELLESLNTEPHLWSVVTVRNGLFHRKYFGMIRLGYNNQDEFQNEDVFRKATEMRAGYFVPVNVDGVEVRMSDSIAYERLSQQDFEKLYNEVWKVLQDKYGFDEDFLNELNTFA